MGLFSGIVSAVSAVTSFISTALPAVGPAIARFATTLVTKLPELQLLTKILVGVIQGVAEAFGLIKENDTAEELGAKAVECDKKPEDFKSTEDYINYLRNEVQVDSDKLKNMSDVEKFACSSIGVAILSKGIEEKVGMFIPSDFWVEVGKQNIKADEVKAYIDAFKDNGFTELNMSDYLKGNLNVSENKQVSPIMESVLSKLNPELSQSEVKDKLFDMKLASQENEGR